MKTYHHRLRHLRRLRHRRHQDNLLKLFKQANIIHNFFFANHNIITSFFIKNQKNHLGFLIFISHSFAHLIRVFVDDDDDDDRDMIISLR